MTEGYTTQKLKARPWWNVFSQVDQISAVTPPDHTLDVDWNDMLQVRGEAAAVLTELDRRPRIGIYESPLHRGDAEGLRALRQQVRRPLADHLTADSFRNSLLRDSLDGYVLFASGATGMVAQSRTCDEFDKSYFVQVLGAGLTTAYCLQLSAVMPGARWPMVTCLNIYSDDLLIEPIRIVGGQALVPDGPGLGVDVDEDALERLRVDPSSGPTMPRHIVTATLGSDRRRYTTIKALWNECRRPGRLPVQPDNAAMEIRVDDGSADFDRDYRSVGAQPVSTV